MGRGRVSFSPLSAADFPTLCDWLNRPHVSEWWGPGPTEADVNEEFGPLLAADSTTKAYLVIVDGRPTGYIQSYVAMSSGDGWWEEVRDPGVRGIDQFLAESDRLDQGIGTAVVRAFLEFLVRDPAVTRVQVDPSPGNGRAIRCYQKAGFRAIGEVDTPDGRSLIMVSDPDDRLAQDLAALYPPDVATRHLSIGGPTPPLYPVEAAAIQRAIPPRRHEFALGRACARAALRQLGISESALPVGPNRAPVWPLGATGSISHCRDWAVAAAVVTTGRIKGIGVDVEVAGALDPELRNSVCTPEEFEWIRTGPEIHSTDWFKIMFSAKESVYKCVAPSSGEMPGFGDILIRIDSAAGEFQAQAARPLSESVQQLLGRLHGRFRASGRFILTGAVVQ